MRGQLSPQAEPPGIAAAEVHLEVLSMKPPRNIPIVECEKGETDERRVRHQHSVGMATELGGN